MRVAIVSAVEAENPLSRERVRWALLTNLPVNSKRDAVTALGWYKQRWKIDIDFKILKSGFKAKESKLRAAN